MLAPAGAALAAIIAAKAAPAKITIKLILIIAFLFIRPAHALENVSLDVGSLAGEQWQLEGISIALTDLGKSPQKLTLTIARLSLPKPFDDLSLVNIRCTAFTWKNKELLCQQGTATMRSKRWRSPTAYFSFQVTEEYSSFKLSELHLAGGTIAIEGEVRGERWQLRVNAKAVDGPSLQQLLPQELFTLQAGKIDLKLAASGRHAQLKDFNLTTGLNGLSGQTQDGRLAAEALILAATLNAKNNNGMWQWQMHVEFNDGALYAEPLYLEAAGKNSVLAAQGYWDPSNQRIDIDSARYRHSNVGALSGNATIQYKDGISLDKARLSLSSDNLQDFSAIYLKPFFEQTALQGITLAGHLTADFSINQQVLTALTASFQYLDVNDAAGRIDVQGGAGRLNWSNDQRFNQTSDIAWQQLRVRALPVGPSRLSFLSAAGNITLLKKTQLPFLDGAMTINQFSFQAKKQQEPEVSFEGNLNNVSLEQLSKALNWVPLSGTVSGQIPRVQYSNKTLSLGGELIVKVFGGEIKVSNLASSGLFTDFPKLYADLEIDNLDLDQLTSKFEFGGITGKLSGYVRQLSMENWQPVSFFAWLGTPDDDDSRHRISQKAVKNIANIGGGSAADILSQSFLSFFETFGYGKLGLGCYLHDGVCQLMGVETTESGYAIITPGGLPRINVIGYNPRVDWNVLIERLKRITTSDEVIVE